MLLISAEGKNIYIQREKEGRREEGREGIQIAVLNSMVKEGLTKQVTLKQKPKGKEGMQHSTGFKTRVFVGRKSAVMCSRKGKEFRVTGL